MPSRRVFPAAPVVACCICGCLYRAGSTGILYRSADGQWQCKGELPCRHRKRAREAVLAAMQRALDDTWAALGAAGWRI